MISRRDLLRGLAAMPAAAVAGGLALSWAPRRAAAAFEITSALRSKLHASPYVYVSPLRSNGQESTCHAEVWFAWLDGSVVMTVSSDGWKARSLAAGLDRARIWVGDYGRWKGVVGRNEKFREGPTFDARAQKVTDRSVVDRLLARYDEKYPEEIGRWRDRMSRGFDDGSRTVIRYRPIG